MNTITEHTKAIYSANQAILQVANNIDWENIFCNGLVGYLQYGKYMAARKASLNSLRRGTSSHSGALLLMCDYATYIYFQMLIIKRQNKSLRVQKLILLLDIP